MDAESDLVRRTRELREQAVGPPPETWRPDMPELSHPNPLAGVLQRVYEGPEGDYGITMIADILEPESGMHWSVWLLGQVLQSDFDQAKAGAPRPGQLVAIFYEGMKRKKNAQPGDKNPDYRSYRVIVSPDQVADPPQSARAVPFSGAEPPEPEPVAVDGICPTCNWRDGNHSPGCPDEIPF